MLNFYWDLLKSPSIYRKICGPTYLSHNHKAKNLIPSSYFKPIHARANIAKPKCSSLPSKIFKGTPKQGLYFPAKGDLQIIGFCDADWA